MEHCQPIEFSLLIGHEFNVQKEEGSISESDELEGVHFKTLTVNKCENQFNANKKEPCSHEPVGNCDRFFGRNE